MKVHSQYFYWLSYTYKYLLSKCMYITTKCGCNSLIPCSLEQWIHYFFTSPRSLQLVNSLKIQWNHLVYRDNFYCSGTFDKFVHFKCAMSNVVILLWQGIGTISTWMCIDYHHRNSPCVVWRYVNVPKPCQLHWTLEVNLRVGNIHLMKFSQT
jgi:hypothetical protein